MVDTLCTDTVSSKYTDTVYDTLNPGSRAGIGQLADRVQGSD